MWRGPVRLSTSRAVPCAPQQYYRRVRWHGSSSLFSSLARPSTLAPAPFLLPDRRVVHPLPALTRRVHTSEIWEQPLPLEDHPRQNPLLEFHQGRKEFHPEVSRLVELRSVSQILRSLNRQRHRADVETVNHMVRVLCQRGEMDRALDIVKQMRESCAIEPTVDTYNALMYFFCQQRDYEKAKQMMTYMTLLGIAPDIQTYNVLLYSLSLRDQFSQLLSVFHGLEGFGITPDIHTYNILVEAYCHQGNLLQIQSLIETMTQKGLRADRFTLNCLINAFCQAHKIKEARAIIRQMKAGGTYPDEWSFLPLVRVLCQRNDIRGALDTIKEMEKGYGIAAHVTCYNLLLRFYCQCGHHNSVADLLQKIHTRGIPANVTTHNLHLVSLLQQQRYEAAYDLFYQMIGPGGGVSADEFTFSTLIAALCRVGDVQGALRCWNSMDVARVQASAALYDVMIKQCIRHSLWNKICEFIQQMTQQGIEPMEETMVALLEFSVAMEQNEERIEAINALAEFFPQSSDHLYLQLCDKLASTNEYQSLVRLLQIAPVPATTLAQWIIHFCTALSAEEVQSLQTLIVTESPPRSVGLEFLSVLCSHLHFDFQQDTRSKNTHFFDRHSGQFVRPVRQCTSQAEEKDRVPTAAEAKRIHDYIRWLCDFDRPLLATKLLRSLDHVCGAPQIMPIVKSFRRLGQIENADRLMRKLQ